MIEDNLTYIKRIIKLSSIIVGILFLLFIYFISPDNSNRTNTIEISSGDSIKSIATTLKNNHIIRSTSLLRLSISLMGGENKIKAGVYQFDKPQDVFTIAYRLSHEKYGYIPVKLTFPEGITSKDILNIIYSKYPNLNSSSTISLKEGYLFPDTYFFPPNADINMITNRMYKEYDTKIKVLRDNINRSGHSESDIIKMASILEKEVNSTEDRRMVADLLWRRISNGMLLQVDSTLGYVTGKESLELTMNDLSSNSPYNTYKYKGLPPTPISNPGIDAISSAINPISNEYLFFLTDKEGKVHYSKTYEEHLRFKKKYIR